MELIVKNLSYTYPSGVRALNGITFRVGYGEKMAVVGPNGAGKSTLLLALAGLLSGRNGLEGEITWRGKDSESPAPVRTGFLFQNPDDQIIASSVEDDVGFALLRKGVERERARSLIGEALRQVHLEGCEERAPLEMSFGEKKRMCLAGLLVARPDVLCLDEPSLGLDFRERDRLIEVLKGISRTTILSSLDLELVSELSDRVLVLDGGRPAAEGTAAELFPRKELMRKHGLKPDYAGRPNPVWF